MQFYSKLGSEITVYTTKNPFIDAHHHLWNLKVCHYPWLMAKGEKRFFGDPTPIQKNYLAQDFLNESHQCTPAKSVHIQVGAALQDEIKETAWLQEQTPVPTAIVAATDLSAKNVEEQLLSHRAYDKLRGVRQILGRHAEEDKKHNSDMLLEHPGFIAGLKLLEREGLSFDLQMIPPQTPRILKAMEHVPELRISICHAGSPWDQSPEGLAKWRKGMKDLANLPKLTCKISGLGMFNPDWQVRDLRPIMLDVIEIFGPQRVMLGSNFPVDKLYSSYDALWNAYDEITAGFSIAERRSMYYDTAAEFYQI
ncbi:MAG: amidohydrolase family protein [Halioglobus sp.]